jgi:hypothetical protein
MNQDNSEKKIHNGTIQQIITITITVFVSCLIITSFFFAMCKLDTDNFERWIGFCGSIIGGAMTLVGVLLTIKFEIKSRNDDDKKKYKPFIFSEDKEIIIAKINKQNVDFSFTIYNKGGGEACNVRVISDNHKIPSNNNNEDLIIPKDTEKLVSFTYPIDDNNDYITELNNGIEFKIIYDGVFEKNLDVKFTKIVQIEQYKELNILPFKFLKK